MPEPADGPAPDANACPNCGRGRDAKRRCWSCFDRPCARCDRMTGGCFFPHCIACQDREDAEVRACAPPDGPGEGPGPARAWVFVARPRAGDVATSVRVRQVIKYALRRHGLDVVALPNRVPDDFLACEAVDYETLMGEDRRS